MCVSKHNSSVGERVCACLKPQAKGFMPMLGMTVWLHRRELQLLNSFPDQALGTEK